MSDYGFANIWRSCRHEHDEVAWHQAAGDYCWLCGEQGLKIKGLATRAPMTYRWRWHEEDET